MNTLTKEAVLTNLQGHIVGTESVLVAHELMQRSFDGALGRGNNRSVFIEGESGTGKTSILKSFAMRYPAVRTPDGMKMSIVCATVPSKPTVKGLALVLLHAIGDPNLKGVKTEQHLTFKLIKQIRAIGALIIMLDEFQHFVDQGTEKVQYHVADWLKCLIDETGVNLVVSGLPNAEFVLKTNVQLKRRFMAPVVLQCYDWLVNESREEFIRFLCEMAELAGPCVFPDLEDEEMAKRFYFATAGNVGRVINLLCEVVENAFYYKKFNITLPDLDLAAVNASFDNINADVRPFSDTFEVRAA